MMIAKRRLTVTAVVLACAALVAVGIVWVAGSCYEPWRVRKGQPLLDAIFEYRGSRGEWPEHMEDVLDVYPELRRTAGWHYRVPRGGGSAYRTGDWHYRRKEDGGFWLYTDRMFRRGILGCRVRREGPAWRITFVGKGLVVPAGMEATCPVQTYEDPADEE